MRGCSASIQALTNCSRAFMLSPQRALSKPLNLYTFSSFRAKQTGAVCAQAAYICLLQKTRSPQKKPRLRALCYPSSTNLNKEPLSLLLLFTLSQTASPDLTCASVREAPHDFYQQFTLELRNETLPETFILSKTRFLPIEVWGEASNNVTRISKKVLTSS